MRCDVCDRRVERGWRVPASSFVPMRAFEALGDELFLLATVCGRCYAIGLGVTPTPHGVLVYLGEPDNPTSRAVAECPTCELRAFGEPQRQVRRPRLPRVEIRDESRLAHALAGDVERNLVHDLVDALEASLSDHLRWALRFEGCPHVEVDSLEVRSARRGLIWRLGEQLFRRHLHDPAQVR